MMPPKLDPAPLSETERPSSLLPNAKIAYHLRRADEWKRAYTAGKRDPRAEVAELRGQVASLTATVRAFQQRNVSLGQPWVTRVTTAPGADSPDVQGAGAVEPPRAFVRFALNLAVATLADDGCNCHPEGPCALCMCQEALIQFDAYESRQEPLDAD